MGFLRTVIGWATSAWGVIFGIGGDIGNALSHLWHFIGSVHALVDHLISTVVRDLDSAHLGLSLWQVTAIGELFHALQRVAGWIWRHFILPLRADYLKRIAALKAWTTVQLIRLWLLEITLYNQALGYTRTLVGVERQQRIAADRAEHAAMLKAVAAAVALIQSQAASGYKAGNHQRTSAITRLADDLASRNPLLRGLIGRLVTALLDLLAIDDPLLRVVIGVLLRQVISRLGVDRVAGDLLSALIGPLAAGRDPRNLHDVAADLAARVSALEETWARYMEDGGPELDQAGRAWKEWASLGFDLALLGFLGAAVAAPQAWATAVADTAGTAVDDTVRGISALIRRA